MEEKGRRRSGKWREFFFLSSNSVLISHVNYTKNSRCFFHFEQNSFPKTKKPFFLFWWMNFISTKCFVWNSFLEKAGNGGVCVCVVLRASLGFRLFDPSPVWPPPPSSPSFSLWWCPLPLFRQNLGRNILKRGREGKWEGEAAACQKEAATTVQRKPYFPAKNIKNLSTLVTTFTKLPLLTT